MNGWLLIRRLRGPAFLILIGITFVYLASNEIVKRIFWKPNQRTA